MGSNISDAHSEICSCGNKFRTTVGWMDGWTDSVNMHCMVKSQKVIVFLIVNGPCLLDYLILKLRLPVVLYVSFAVDSR